MTSEHVIVVERRSDFRWSDPGVRIVTAEAFIAEEPRPRARARKVTNLCRNYSYLGMGYYCSLLAEARGDRVTPSVETIVALQRGKQQAASLAVLDRLIGPLASVPQSVSTLTLDVFFGRTEDAELTALARKGFELFRCPLLRLHLQRREPSPGWHVAALQSLDPRDVDAHRDGLFDEALARFTRRHWRPAAPAAAPPRRRPRRAWTWRSCTTPTTRCRRPAAARCRRSWTWAKKWASRSN